MTSRRSPYHPIHGRLAKPIALFATLCSAALWTAPSHALVTLGRQDTPWRQTLAAADQAITQGDYANALTAIRRAKQYTSQSCDFRYIDILLRLTADTQAIFPVLRNDEEILTAYDYFVTQRLERITQPTFRRFCPQYNPTQSSAR